jgi:TPP-dependent pyruvate/acetoin dehydrogenase alpha subunit
MVTKAELIAFEREIADLFNAKKIPAVIHLYSGGEDALIEIFKNIRPQDWVLCSWRSHYECLLKGVPKAELKAAILAGNSIHLSFPKYRVLSSGIVGGTPPIAVGLALGIKRSGEDAQVHCFIGDMTSETGIVHECMKYSENFMLPVTFWIADNGLSATTDTKKVWGLKRLTNVPAFTYEMSRYHHAGTDKWVKF